MSERERLTVNPPMTAGQAWDKWRMGVEKDIGPLVFSRSAVLDARQVWIVPKRKEEQ